MRDEAGRPPDMKTYVFSTGGTRCPSRRDEAKRSTPVFIGRDRTTPFGVYKIESREGWGDGVGEGGQDGRIGPIIAL